MPNDYFDDPFQANKIQVWGNPWHGHIQSNSQPYITLLDATTKNSPNTPASGDNRLFKTGNPHNTRNGAQQALDTANSHAWTDYAIFSDGRYSWFSNDKLGVTDHIYIDPAKQPWFIKFDVQRTVNDTLMTIDIKLVNYFGRIGGYRPSSPNTILGSMNPVLTPNHIKFLTNDRFMLEHTVLGDKVLVHVLASRSDTITTGDFRVIAPRCLFEVYEITFSGTGHQKINDADPIALGAGITANIVKIKDYSQVFTGDYDPGTIISAAYDFGIDPGQTVDNTTPPAPPPPPDCVDTRRIASQVVDNDPPGTEENAINGERVDSVGFGNYSQDVNPYNENKKSWGTRLLRIFYDDAAAKIEITLEEEIGLDVSVIEANDGTFNFDQTETWQDAGAFCSSTGGTTEYDWTGLARLDQQSIYKASGTLKRGATTIASFTHDSTRDYYSQTTVDRGYVLPGGAYDNNVTTFGDSTVTNINGGAVADAVYAELFPYFGSNKVVGLAAVIWDDRTKAVAQETRFLGAASVDLTDASTETIAGVAFLPAQTRHATYNQELKLLKIHLATPENYF